MKRYDAHCNATAIQVAVILTCSRCLPVPYPAMVSYIHSTCWLPRCGAPSIRVRLLNGAQRFFYFFRGWGVGVGRGSGGGRGSIWITFSWFQYHHYNTIIIIVVTVGVAVTFIDIDLCYCIQLLLSFGLLCSLLFLLLSRPISQITRQLSHNAPFCNRKFHTCAQFCYRMVHCGIWGWRILGLLQQVFAIESELSVSVNKTYIARQIEFIFVLLFYVHLCLFWVAAHCQCSKTCIIKENNGSRNWRKDIVSSQPTLERGSVPNLWRHNGCDGLWSH